MFHPKIDRRTRSAAEDEFGNNLRPPAGRLIEWRIEFENTVRTH
jgi:hypothetical protein